VLPRWFFAKLLNANFLLRGFVLRSATINFILSAGNVYAAFSRMFI
jgi:hypothetical protein